MSKVLWDTNLVVDPLKDLGKRAGRIVDLR